MNGNDAGKRYVLLIATIASFVTPFMGSSVNVALPAIGRDLHLDVLTLNWILTAYLLTSAMFLLPLGKAADLYGRKRLFLLGMFLYSFSSLLCGLAGAGEALVAFRVVQGIGAAMIFGTSLAMLTSVYPPEERGRVLGLNVASVYTGLSIGPAVGGYMTDHFGWRSLFVLNFVLGMLALAITLLKLKGDWQVYHKTRYDLTGALLYGLGIGASMYGLAVVNSNPHGRIVLATGAGLLGLFAWRERCTSAPLLELGLFRNVTFAFSNLAALIHYSATFAVGYLLSLYLQHIKGWGAQDAGLVLLSQPVLMAVVSPMAGRLSDRFEPRLIASTGMGMTFVGLLLMVLLNAASPAWGIMADLAVIGAGLGLFSSPNTNAILGSVARAHLGVASATLGTMRMVGQALSMALVSFVFALYLKGQHLDADTNPLLLKCLRLTFALFAGLCLLGLFASLARGRIHNKSVE